MKQNEEEKNQLVDITEEEAMSVNHSFEVNAVPSKEDDGFKVTMSVSGDPTIIGESIVDILMDNQEQFLELLMEAMATRVQVALVNKIMDKFPEDIN